MWDEIGHVLFYDVTNTNTAMFFWYNLYDYCNKDYNHLSVYLRVCKTKVLTNAWNYVTLSSSVLVSKLEINVIMA